MSGWFRRLTLHSVTSALYVVVPVPLLDDHLLAATRRRMVRELAAEHGLELSEAQVRHLSGTESSAGLGCFGGFVVGLALALVLKIPRRLFRTVFFFLAIKDAADAASRTFHEGYLLRQAMPDLARQFAILRAHGAEGIAGAVPWEVRRVRSAVADTCAAVDTRPIERTLKAVFRSSFTMLRRAARLLAQRERAALHGAPRSESSVAAGDVLAPGLVDRLARALSVHGDYLGSLVQDLRRRLSAPTQDPGP